MSDVYDIPPEPGFEPELAVLVAGMNRNTRNYRENIGKVGRKAMRWQPFPHGHSIGAILLHMADTEAYWMRQIGEGTPLPPAELAELMSKETNQLGVKWPIPPDQPLSDYYAIQDRIRAQTLEILAHHAGSDLSTSARPQMTFRWLVNHVTTHETYHFGQIMLLKLMHTRRQVR